MRILLIILTALALITGCSSLAGKVKVEAFGYSIAIGEKDSETKSKSD